MTVAAEVIRRRAEKAVPTVSKSFHEDCMRENAEVRSKLGFKCYLNRIAATGCCKWCTDIAGRYVYGDHPDDIFGRHDNCSCTVTFENGRERHDMWSKRTWQEDPAEVEANGFKPVVNSQEEAKRIQTEGMKWLTHLQKPAIMKNIELPPETDLIRSMSDETKQLISNAFDKIMGMYDVHLDKLITEPIYKADGKTIEKTVPFQFQPRRGKDGELIRCIVINSMYDFMGSQDGMQQRIMKNFNNKALSSNSIEGLIAHELAHVITSQSDYTYSGLLLTNKQLIEEFGKLSESCNLSEISLYAAMKGDISEVIAESFVKVLRGEAIPEPVTPYLKEYIERWRK